MVEILVPNQFFASIENCWNRVEFKYCRLNMLWPCY